MRPRMRTFLLAPAVALLLAAPAAGADPAPAARQVQVTIQHKGQQRAVCLAMPALGSGTDAIDGGTAPDAPETSIRLGHEQRGRDEILAWTVKRFSSGSRIHVSGGTKIADLTPPIIAYQSGDVVVRLALGCGGS